MLFAAMCAVLFPSYAAMRYTYLPVRTQICNVNDSYFIESDITIKSMFVDAMQPVTIKDAKDCYEQDFELKVDTNFPIYCMTLATTIGWVFLCFYLPTGMWACVFEYIGDYVTRPRKLADDEKFNNLRTELSKKVEKLITSGKKIQIDRENISATKIGTGNAVQRYRKRREIMAAQNLFENNCMVVEDEFQKLD